SGDHRTAGGDDRLDRSADRSRGRHPDVGEDPQLFAESRYVEEGIVGGRSDDEDEEDALGLPAQQQDPGLREPPDRQQRDGEGEDARQEYRDRQEEGTVDR